VGVWVGWGAPFSYLFLLLLPLFLLPLLYTTLSWIHCYNPLCAIENFVFLSMSLFQFHIPLDAIIIIYIAINSYAKRYMPPIFYRSYLSWMAACMVYLSRQGRFSTSISAGLIGIFAPGRRTSHWRLGAQKLEFRA